MIPNGAIKSLNYFTNTIVFNGFNSLPHYHIIDCLYKYRDNTEVCFLLSFTNIVYDIIKNEDYYIFMGCKNFDKTFINFVMNHFLDICEDELLKKYKINHRCIYKQTKKNFSPRESFEYYYRYINQNIDVSKINSIIDYICFLIHQIKIEYDFIVIYNKIDSRITQLLKNM